MNKSGKRGRSVATVEPTLEMCGVRVGEMLFGVPITQVIEILGNQSTRTVPLAPAFIGGLVHYRGDVLTTVSLRQLLEMPPTDALQDILVLEGPSGSFGMQVDGVREVLTVAPADFEPNPSTLNDRCKSLFAGAYKLKDGLLVMLDAERLDPMHLSATLCA